MEKSRMTSIRPAYVPDGFRLGPISYGPGAGGFWGSRRQFALTYVRRGDFRRSLIVHVAPRAEADVLHATETRPGVAVELAITGARGIYHDGLWTLGGGANGVAVGANIIHWNASDAHSLTVQTDDIVVGIRAARSSGVTVEELVRIAESLPIRA